jgi:hypothetical protein
MVCTVSTIKESTRSQDAVNELVTIGQRFSFADVIAITLEASIIQKDTFSKAVLGIIGR